MNIKDRISQLLVAINRGVYEKETELSLSLLAALAGESILLLGPPGVAKSMVARRLKATFRGAHAFEYLMSRFSTPDELFGPISINRLKEHDKYERAVQGYLPTAGVVFLDEIWKAGPAIQNSLLTAINEKIYRNGDVELKLPLKLLIAASNELPAQGEGLEALWDRFLVRIICSCVKTEETFYQMLLDNTSAEVTVPEALQITEEEYAQWQKTIDGIDVPRPILTLLTRLRLRLKRVSFNAGETTRSVYVSDRRWKNAVRLLKASAFMNGRTAVAPSDLLPLHYCLWNEADEYEPVRQLLAQELFAPHLQCIEELTEAIETDLRLSRVRQALVEFQKEHTMKHKLAVKDYFYYHVEEYGQGNSYIFAVDFLALKEQKRENAARQAIVYPDPLHPGRMLIRCYPATVSIPEGVCQRVNLYRQGSEFLVVDGILYPMEQVSSSQAKLANDATTASSHITARNYSAEITSLSQEVKGYVEALCTESIFITAEDKELVAHYATEVLKQLREVEIEGEKLQFSLRQHG